MKNESNAKNRLVFHILWKDRNQDPIDPEDDRTKVYGADIVDRNGDVAISLVHRARGWTGFLDRTYPNPTAALDFALLAFGETLESVR